MPDYRLVRYRGKWAINYVDPVRGRVRVSLGTDDRGAAEARARRVWAARQAPVGERVSDLWNAYLEDRKVDKIAIDPSGSTWKALSPSFGHMLARAITRDDCRLHYEKRKRQSLSDSTIRKELEMLRAALRLSLGDQSPSIWMPPPAKPRERFLTRAELTTVLESIETPHVRLFVILAISTAARMSALLDLEWSQVDLRRRFIDLNPSGRHQNNKRRAVVPINDRAFEALVEAHAGATSDFVIEYGGGPVKSVKKGLQAAAERSGIQFSAHVLRHTAAVWLAEADVPMQKIAQYLGHTSTRVTEQTYARYSPSFMRDAAQVLDW